MPAYDMKLCPFCAEEVRIEAIKCRYCGERLEHDLVNPAPELELREFIIPFPEGSPPRTMPINLNSYQPFSVRYLQAMGIRRPDRHRDLFAHTGLTHIWNFYAPYFRERLYEIEETGWELVSAFEPKTDYNGVLTTKAIGDRFSWTPDLGSGAGTFAGCKFNLRRKAGALVTGSQLLDSAHGEE